MADQETKASKRDFWKDMTMVLSGIVGSMILQWGTFILFIANDVPARSEVSRQIEIEAPWNRDKALYESRVAALESAVSRISTDLTHNTQALIRIDVSLAQLVKNQESR